MVGFRKAALHQYDHQRKSSMETCQSARCCACFGRRYIGILVAPFCSQGVITCIEMLKYPPDSEVDGMLLPKGSTVVLNVWAMHHDSNTWKDPEHFIPERFESYSSLASTYAASGKWDERDHYGYGAGRRICPGESTFKKATHIQKHTKWRINALRLPSSRNPPGRTQSLHRRRQTALGVQLQCQARRRNEHFRGDGP